MRVMQAVVLAVVAGGLTGAASGVVVPFVETFEGGVANWRNANNSADLDFVAGGGADGGAYASGVFNYANTSSGGFPPIVLRGQASSGASGGAFVGDWLAAGVTEFLFEIRHDAPVALEITGRIATPGNFPGASFETDFLVEPGVWTTVGITIDENDPRWVSFSNQPFEATFGNVGNIQIGANVPEALVGQDITVRFDLDLVRIVPSPAGLAAFSVLGLGMCRRRRG
ncbi:MAG: hypothetical protein EA378_05825 [Phycisphaerales bacterium]|nr:MAG: hypothetical protein EA378_05825 [Phycisphaerales bacterium]